MAKALPTRRPLGRALHWSAQDRTDVARIRPADVAAAALRWRTYAGRAALLGAVVKPEQEATDE